MSSMTKDITIKLPLVSQFKETKNAKWKHYTCGICAIKMLMSFKKPENIKISVMEMVKKTLSKNGYIESVGWRHSALVWLASQYGVKLNFQKLFPKTKKDKTRGLKFIERNIKNLKPVIVSVFRELNPKNGGHLVVINGTRSNTRGIAGYYIQDPDHRFKGNNYFVTKKEFLNGWRGGMIWLK